MNKIEYFLCVSLALTNISFFSIGFADFTLFHGTLILFMGYVLVRDFPEKLTSIKISTPLTILILYISLSNFIFATNYKGTSLIYSIVIIIELIVLSRISRKLELDQIRKITKCIILLYTLSIFIEFLLIKFNITPTGAWSVIFQTYNDGKQVRPMGLANEPSYAAIIVVFTLYVLLRSENFLFRPKESGWYLAAIISIYLSSSSYGYVLLFLLLSFFAFKSHLFSFALKFIVKNKSVGIFILSILVISLFAVLYNTENKSFQRLATIFSILGENGLNFTGLFNISNTDSSAGMRIIPTLQLIEYFSQTDFISLLFGQGAGQATFFYSELWGQLTLVGFIPAFVYNYGLIGTFVTLSSIFLSFPRKKTVLLIMFSLFLFNADFNTQIFVFVVFTAMLSRQIESLSIPSESNAVTRLDQQD